MNNLKRIEIYIDNKNSLAIDVYKTLEEDEYPYKKYTGPEANEYIKKLALDDIVDTFEADKYDYITLEYKKNVVNLNEPELLVKKRGMGPIIKNLKKYYELDSVKEIKNKKVTRKNKHTSKRIIAASLAAIILYSCTVNFFKKETKNQTDNEITTSTTQNIDRESENEVMNLSFKTNNEKSSQKQQSEKEETITKKEETKIKEKPSSIVINYSDRSSEEKVHITKEYYGQVITKYAKQYGLDPALVLAIATQEKGIHSPVKDEGGATGLMQLQNAVWEDEYITAYNFETQKKETVYVTREKIKDVFYNIKIGCMYLQNCMDYMDNNIVAAVQCYNMGHGSMMKILRTYSAINGKSIEEILQDEKDLGWLDYRNVIEKGDQKYVEHVFSWLGHDIEINNTKKDNTLVTINVKK